MSGDEPYMQVRMGVVGLVALLIGCGGKTVGVPSSSSSEASEPAPTPSPVASPAGTGSSDPVPDPVPESPRDPTCAATFARDVMPVLTANNCTLSACHGGASPPNLPRIDPTAPFDTWLGFTEFTLSNGARYLSTSRPMTSAMLCNVQASASCGAHMPLGGQLSADDYLTVAAWLGCGARP